MSLEKVKKPPNVNDAFGTLMFQKVHERGRFMKGKSFSPHKNQTMETLYAMSHPVTFQFRAVNEAASTQLTSKHFLL